MYGGGLILRVEGFRLLYATCQWTSPSPLETALKFETPTFQSGRSGIVTSGTPESAVGASDAP